MAAQSELTSVVSFCSSVLPGAFLVGPLAHMLACGKLEVSKDPKGLPNRLQKWLNQPDHQMGMNPKSTLSPQCPKALGNTHTIISFHIDYIIIKINDTLFNY